MGAEQACTEAAAWPDGIKIAVNVSPVQFKNPRRLLTSSARLRRPACRSRLELEITETAIIHNEEGDARRYPAADRVCEIALDDFGTGYSSLSYLQRVPVRQDQDRSILHREYRERPQFSQPSCQAVITVAKARNVVTLPRASRPNSKRTCSACGLLRDARLLV